MPITAYAVAQRGSILVDTIRATEGEAKSAAVQRLKQTGIGWKDLVKSGHTTVRVCVVVEPSRQRPPARRYLCSPADTPAWVRARARHESRLPHETARLLHPCVEVARPRGDVPAQRRRL